MLLNIYPGRFQWWLTYRGSGLGPVYSAVSALQGISDRLGSNANVLYDRGIPKLSMVAMRSGFMLAPDKLVPGLTVETFDNPQFSGKPLATRTEATANSGQNMLDNPDIMEILNNLTAEQMSGFMGAGAGGRYTRWTGYYLARAAGNFVVFVENQGQYRFTIDDKPVIDHSEIQYFATSSAYTATSTLNRPRYGSRGVEPAAVCETADQDWQTQRNVAKNQELTTWRGMQTR